MALSELSRIALLTEYMVEQSFPENRPKIVPIIIPVTAGAGASEVINIGDQLRNYQVFSIVGFTAAHERVTKAALAAKIASIAGATDDELNYFDESILQSPGFSTYGLIYSIIESANIIMTLAGGHGLATLHFYCLPASYLVAQTSINQIVTPNV